MKNFIRNIIKGLFYFISPAIAMFLLELCIYRDSQFVWEMINAKQDQFLFAYLIILLVQTLFTSIINNLYLTLVVTQFISGVVGTITYYKIHFLNEPLLPWDIYMVKQAIDLIPTLSNSIDVKWLILGLLAFIVVIVLFIKFTSFKLLSWQRRLLLFWQRSYRSLWLETLKITIGFQFLKTLILRTLHGTKLYL